MPAMCGAVRDLLPELVLGVLPGDQRAEVEAHVAWCAGCRKESAELGQGAATLAFALSPATPPERVEQAVVDAIRSSASVPAGRRRARTAAAATIAAMVAVSALGWGAVMAGRAERTEVRAQQELEEKLEEAARKFQDFLDGATGIFAPLPMEGTHLGKLRPLDPDGTGGGFVLQLSSRSTLDFVFVHVSGLPTDRDRAPFRIYLRNGAGEELPAGRIGTVAPADGSGETFKQFVRTELAGYTYVVVRDAADAIVLRGSIDTQV